LVAVRKVLVALLCLLVLLTGAAAAAAWRYDDGRKDRLAEGVVIAGMDVGGLRAPAARAALHRRIVEPLSEPISVRYKGGQFVFSATEAEVRTNVDALVAQALARSRSGSFLTRAYRDVRSEKLTIDLTPEVTYTNGAVDRFVDSVRKAVNTRPHEAKSKASFAGVRITPSQNGVVVRGVVLKHALAEMLVDPEASRTIQLPTRVLRPKVSTRDLEKRFHYFIAVSRSRKELRWFVKEKLVKTYRVAIGRIGFETPAGLYEIRTKAVNPAWYVPKKPWAGDLAGKIIPPGDPENPLKARWMGFWDGAGIHGTAEASSIGSAASHGCIRMTVHDVVDLYDRVPLHTPLYIS
jgi:lipoprotein-anchoring transpeptidase ErfK/SrfK